MSKLEIVRTIVRDFLFEPIADLREVLERHFPDDPVEISGGPTDRTITVGDVACHVTGRSGR